MSSAVDSLAFSWLLESEVGGIQEDGPELIFRNHSIPCHIMLLHGLIELLLSYLVAHLRQRRHNIVLRYAARVVSVELIENRCQSIFV